MTASEMVEVRDRRELPFFQVRLGALAAIGDAAGGPRRLRAVGFYALLCQLANEQRHVGEHREVRAGYPTLADRGRVSRATVKQMLDALSLAGVVRRERVDDAERGTTVMIVHLPVQHGAWTAVTVAMVEQIATPRAGGHLLCDLGLIVVLLELCASQRAELGGLSAQATRGEIAARAGISVDRLDDRIRLLEDAGILSVERRRRANGGRHLPSSYTIHEAPPVPCDVATLAPRPDHSEAADRCRQGRKPVPAGPQTGPDRAASQGTQGGRPVPAGPQTGPRRAANQGRQGGEPVPVGPQHGTPGAANEYRQGGNAATPGNRLRPSIARAGEQAVENDIEVPPPTPPSADTQRGERDAVDTAALELCEALIAAWEPALGDSPRRRFHAEQAAWLAAAAELLAAHPRPRLQNALDHMVCDEIFGSRALTMRGFAGVVDQLLARHHARQRRTSGPLDSPTAGELDWARARELLERAIARHGRDDRKAALAELREHCELFAAFVEQVRWATLCEEPMRYSEPRYAQLWTQLAHAHKIAAVGVAA